MSKINVSQVVAKHNAESQDGYQYILISPENIEFLEKMAHDNGVADNTTAANIALSQARLAFDAYEARMRERFAEEDADGEGEDETADRYVNDGSASASIGIVNIPGVGFGIGGHIPDELQAQLAGIFGGLGQRTSGQAPAAGGLHPVLAALLKGGLK